MRTSKVIVLAAAAAFALPLAACQDIEHLSAVSGPAASAPAPGRTALSATEAPFGPACAAVPADPSDKGSFAALAQAPVASAAGQSAQLSEFAAALREAGLTRKLDAATGITVFAPTNAAYHEVPANGNAAIYFIDTVLTP